MHNFKDYGDKDIHDKTAYKKAVPANIIVIVEIIFVFAIVFLKQKRGK